MRRKKYIVISVIFTFALLIGYVVLNITDNHHEEKPICKIHKVEMHLKPITIAGDSSSVPEFVASSRKNFPNHGGQFLNYERANTPVDTNIIDFVCPRCHEAFIKYWHDIGCISPKSVGNIKLGEAKSVFPDYSKEIEAVLEGGIYEGEVPNDFYVEIERKQTELIFHLWHYSAFFEENCRQTGNPGGLCRSIVYDLEKQKVTQKTWWQ